jgi:hypothetical protein
MMDIGASLGFFTRDEKWLTKVLIGGIVSLIPIVNFAVLGYALAVLKNVAEGQDVPLPDWSDFGNLFVKGLMGFVGIFLWLLPGVILYCCAFILGGALGSVSRDLQALGGLVVSCVMCLYLLWALLVAIAAPAALTRFVLTGYQLGSFVQFGNVFRYMTGNLSNYIIALIVSLVANWLAAFGIILCVIGVIFTYFWSILVFGHLFGQVARQAAPASAV